MATPLKPGLTFNNPKPYAQTGHRFVVRIEAFTDGVPGMFNSEADLMQWLVSHPYIKSAKLLEVGEPAKFPGKGKKEKEMNSGKGK